LSKGKDWKRRDYNWEESFEVKIRFLDLQKGLIKVLVRIFSGIKVRNN